LKKFVETFEKIPEDGIENVSRKPKFLKLPIDGAGIQFSHS